MHAEQPDLDALRRRLYAPGSTEDDLARYRSAVAAVPPAVAPEAVSPAPRRRDRRILAAGLVLVPALLLGEVLAARSTVPPTSTGPAARPAARATSLLVGSGVSAGVVAALEEGRSPELVRRLLEHPGERPRALQGATRASAEERWGAGPGSLELRSAAVRSAGGRVTVILVADRATAMRWSATRTAAREDHSSYRQELMSGRVDLEPGVPLAATFASDGPPTRLAVDVSRNVRWDAVVVLTD